MGLLRGQALQQESREETAANGCGSGKRSRYGGLNRAPEVWEGAMRGTRGGWGGSVWMLDAANAVSNAAMMRAAETTCRRGEAPYGQVLGLLQAADLGADHDVRDVSRQGCASSRWSQKASGVAAATASPFAATGRPEGLQHPAPDAARGKLPRKPLHAPRAVSAPGARSCDFVSDARCDDESRLASAAMPLRHRAGHARVFGERRLDVEADPVECGSTSRQAARIGAAGVQADREAERAHRADRAASAGCAVGSPPENTTASSRPRRGASQSSMRVEVALAVAARGEQMRVVAVAAAPRAALAEDDGGEPPGIVGRRERHEAADAQGRAARRAARHAIIGLRAAAARPRGRSGAPRTRPSCRC